MDSPKIKTTAPATGSVLPPDVISSTSPPPPPPPTPATPLSQQSPLQDSSSFSSPPPPPPTAPLRTIPPPAQPGMVSVRRSGLPKGVVISLVVLVVMLVLGLVTSFVFKYTPSLGIGTTTITYWGLWEPESVMKPLIEEYQKSHPRVKIVYQMQSPQEYRERLTSAISQGKGPDIFRIHNTWVPMFRNLLSAVPADVYSSADYPGVFYPTARTDLRSGTNYVAVPLEIDGLLMYTNDGLLAKSGVAVPSNWEDLRTSALAMSVCESEDGTCHPGNKIVTSGVALGSVDNIDHWQDIISVIMMQNNVNFNSVSTSQKAAEDAVNYYTDFVNLYHVWDGILPSSTNQFAAGKVGIYFGPSWRVFDIKKINPGLKFSVHPIPQLPLDPLRNEQPIAWASYWAEAVNSKSSNSKEAWDFVKYISSKENLPKFHQASVSSGREFGEPYSRQDLSDQIKSHPYLGPIAEQAVFARSWYLASFTHDGPSGINTKLSLLFADYINRKKDTNAFATELNQVLSEYGLAVAASTSR